MVGRRAQGRVHYRLFAAADEPLSVAILESGTPLAGGQIFDRAVVLTAAVEGGSGGTDPDGNETASNRLFTGWLYLYRDKKGF